MKIDKNWRRLLVRSASVILAYIATVSSIAGSGLYLLADRLGNETTFRLIMGCAVLSATCTALIPLARIIYQPKLHEDDDDAA